MVFFFMQSRKQFSLLAHLISWAVLLLSGLLHGAHGRELHGDPTNYRPLLRDLKPGDTLILEPGVYRHGLPLHNIKGTPDRPIRIAGPLSGSPAEFQARAEHNTVSLSNTEHVHISGLVLNGQNLGVAAVKGEGHKACLSVHHVVLEDLLIVGHGADQSIVGIASFCPAWNWIIRRNIIVGAGTGLYLGGSDGGSPFVAGLIEQNILVDTVGYNLQIKHQVGRPAGIGMPTQNSRTVLRHNLFTKAHNASSGINARPNLLLGHFPRQGSGSDDHYEVTNNLFFCSPAESLFQGEGNLSIARNIFINLGGDAINVRPHNDVPKNVDILQNFVAASGKGITVTAAPSAYTQAVSGNWIFAPAALFGGTQSANRVAPYSAIDLALWQWLGANRDATPQKSEFGPLIDMANRVCAPTADQHRRHQAWVPDALRQHPACQIIRELSDPTSKPNGTGSLSAGHTEHSDPARCFWR